MTSGLFTIVFWAMLFNLNCIFHTLGGFIHSLRSIAHSLLGDQIFFLPPAALLFSALTGLGGFIVFDDANRDAKRVFLGKMLLLICPVFCVLCLLLGLS